MISSLFTLGPGGISPLPDDPTLMHGLVELSKKIDTDQSPSRIGLVLAFAIRDLEAKTLGSVTSTTYGKAPFDRLAGWLRNAPEKIIRLDQHRQIRDNHVTSAESADPDNADTSKRTYGGAVVFFPSTLERRYEIFISISGAHPKVDEALAYAIGLKLGLTPPVMPHDNPFLEEACQLLGVTFRLAEAA